MNSIFYRLRHKEEILEEKNSHLSGIRLKSSQTDFGNSHNFLHCLVNAGILFFLIAGMATSFCTAFDISCNFFALYLIYFLFAMILALMSIKPWTKNLGYLILFFIFSFILIRNRVFINSGLNAVLNDFFESVSYTLDMDAIKTFQESFPEQRVAAITLFFAAVGFVFMILLNFLFNNEQNPFSVFILVFPILIFHLYFKSDIDLFSLFLLVLSLLLCMIFRQNMQFLLEPPKKRSYRWHQKLTHYLSQYSNGLVIFQASLVIVSIFSILFLFLQIFSPVSSYHPSADETALKKGTNQTVKQLLVSGPASFFFPHEESDGQNGVLGQTGTIIPDFQPDLAITFVPYSFDSVYLKSFEGTSYHTDHWDCDFDNETLKKWFPNESSLTENDFLKTLFPDDELVLSGKMEIERLDSNIMNTYLPYYTDSYSDPAAASYSCSYYVYQDVWDSPFVEAPISGTYDQFINDSFLTIYGSIPPALVTSSIEEEDTHNVTGQLLDLCKEQNFHGSKQEIINQILTFLSENYTYSLNAGKLPKGDDFVTHFLFENPYGSCTYFATAAVLLFRTMGIPARYCEGYVIQLSDIIDGDLTDYPVSEWMSGELSLDRTGVVRTELTDEKAHAWAEVYLNGFGWVPVEATPAGTSEEDRDDFTSFFDRFTNGFSDDDTAGFLSVFSNTDFSQFSAAAKKAVYIMICLVCVFLFIHFLNMTIQNRGKKHGFYDGYNRQILSDYESLCAKVSSVRHEEKRVFTVSEIRKTLKGSELDEYLKLYQDAAFSQKKASKKEAKWFHSMTVLLKKNL